MEIKYTVKKENYLEQLLYDYSNNVDQNKKDRNSYLTIILILFIILGFTLYLEEVVYIITALIFISYYIINYFFFRKARIEKNLSKYISKSLSDTPDVTYSSSFSLREIIFKDDNIETKLDPKAISEVIFLPNTLILKIKTKQNYILSPNIADTEKLISYFKSLQIPILMEIEWKW